MPKKLALTISPPKRDGHIAYVNRYQCIYLDDIHIIKYHFKKHRITNYIIYPEIDPKGRLHYHGILNLTPTQEVSYYKTVQFKLKQIGYIDVKPINSFIENLRWVIYMRKEWNKTKEIIDISEPLLPHNIKKPPKSINNPHPLDQNTITQFFIEI